MIDQNTKIIMSYRELEFHDMQIRAEVIDDFMDKVKEDYPDDELAIYKLTIIAEWLKEQK